MIAYYEGSSANPPANLLPVIASALQVSAEALLGTETEERRQILQLVDASIERGQLHEGRSQAGGVVATDQSERITNKTMLPRMLWQRVRVWPLSRRVRTDGLVLPRMDDDWIPVSFDTRAGVRLMNVRTHHVAALDFADIRQYDGEAARDFEGLGHGRLRLRVQLTLSGCNLYKRRLSTYRPRRRKAH